MARSLRIEYPGAFYHVIQRGIERRDIFSLDTDREKFFAYLNASFLAYKTIVHAYVLMNNHYHLILETPEANLSKAMHYINTGYAAYYNAKHKRAGHLYQGRFKAIIVDKDEYLHYLSCYIHLNPVRAGIVKYPRGYRYSSYSYFISDDKSPQWLNTGLMLSMFDSKTAKAKMLYKQFVADNAGKEKEIIKNNIKNGFVLGGDEFFELIKAKISAAKNDPEIPVLRDVKSKEGPSLEHIRYAVEKLITHDKRLARSISIYFSRQYTQKTNNEIAAFYGKIGYTGVSQAYRRIGERREKNRNFDKLIATLDSKIDKGEV
jgi:REP element-mobilizing transposase RayT